MELLDKINSQLAEYEAAANEALRIYWINLAAAEALKRLLEEMEQPEAETPAEQERYCESEV